MKRFTKRDEFGNADIIGVDSEELMLNLTADEFNIVTDALNMLAEYEDLEGEGKLLKLPCAVGDTVYFIYEAKIYPMKVENILLASYGFAFTLLYDGIKNSLKYWRVNIDNAIGKIVFLTQEEAEAALKELTEREMI